MNLKNTTVLLSRKHLLFAFVLLLLSVEQGQTAESEPGFWGTASVSKLLSGDWLVNMAVQSRSVDFIDRLERYLLRPSISYRFNESLSASLGYDVHFIKAGSDLTEQRPWQQLLYKGSTEQFLYLVRFRLEERVFDSVDDTGLRSRILLGVIVPTGHQIISKLVLRNEIFFNHNDVNRGPQSGFDQNRLFAGFQIPLSKSLQGELGYQNQYINFARVEDLSIHQMYIALSLKLK